MATVNAFNITQKGFFYINDKIVGSRVFSENLITAVGNPTVQNGVARSFSEHDYFTYSPLVFDEETDKITISFEGQFFTADREQFMWELGSSSGTPITLSMTNSSLSIKHGLFSIINIRSIPLEDNTKISGMLVIRANTYELTFRYGNKTTQKTGVFLGTLDLTQFVNITIGNCSYNREAFWNGYFDLTHFYISRNGEPIYTPSEGASWGFSKILVSDGEFELTDKSVPIAGHIFEFPVKEITHSGNTVLITSEINESAYLVIKEIGLYITTKNGQVLFGYIDKLNIKKSKNLPYDLIFTVNTTLNVVNVIGFPVEGDIVVDDPNFVRLSEYNNIKEVNLYVLTNLERIVRMNATGIGYNRAQNVYRLQKQLEEDEGCYNTLDSFMRLTNKFHKVIEKQVDLESTQIYGNPEIDKNGNISNFSNSNFLVKSTPFNSTSNWHVDVPFSTKDPIEGTIFSLSTPSVIQPLQMTTANNNFSLKIGRMDALSVNYTGNPSVNLGTFYRNCKLDTTVDTDVFYGWTSPSSTPYYNFHCSNLSPSTSPRVTCPLSNAVWSHDTLNPDSWSISIKAKTTSISTTQSIIGAASSSYKSVSLVIENEKARFVLYDGTTNNAFVDTTSRFKLEQNRYYTFTIANDNGNYTFKYVADVESSSEYPSEETRFSHSDHRISLDQNHELIFGSSLIGELDFDNTFIQALNADDEPINWEGAAEMDIMYTDTNSPTVGSTLYDSDLYEVLNASITDASIGNYIVSLPNAFTLYPNVNYRVTVSYDSITGHYIVKKSMRGNAFETLFDGETTETITDSYSKEMNIPSETVIGVLPVYSGTTISEGSDPFTGSVDLLNCDIVSGEDSWPFGIEKVLYDKELIQYYRLPDYDRHEFSVNDLCGFARKINFLENRFSGENDLIDFSYDKGLTLCMKVFIQNSYDKTLLLKSNLIDNIYFSLSYVNNTLLFTADTGSDTIVLSKQLDELEYRSYQAEPIMVTVTTEKSGSNIQFKMYKNNEFIADYVGSIVNPPIASELILSNYLESTEDPQKYVSDIIVIKGVISESELFYINNLFDTNY